jgi:hypothetical protein
MSEFNQLDSKGELEAIAEQVAHTANVAEALAGLELPAAEAEVTITGLAEVINRSHRLAKNIGLHAITEGHMSRVHLAQLLGVHQATVGRWVKAAHEQQNQQD